jgi:hypothetical protein
MEIRLPDFDQKFIAWKRFVETGELDRSVISPEIGESRKRLAGCLTVVNISRSTIHRRLKD